MLPPFQELVDAYADEVSRLARALAGPEGAQDAAQSAWLQALRAYPNLSHARNLRGWLLTITARASMDQHRARARGPEPWDEVPDQPTPQQAEPDESLWRLVRALPERQRTAVALRYVMDLPHADIAESLTTSEAATRRLVSDALTTLRSKLAPTD